MTSFAFFKRIARRWKGDDYDPASDNDLSYEDALLDWKIRRFMKAEYGHAKPPHGIFGRVLAAIRSGGSSASVGRAQVGLRLSKLVAQIYGALSRPTIASRFVPGMVAFGLVLAVLTPGARTVNFQESSSPDGQALTYDAQVIIANEIAVQAVKDQVIRRGNVPEGLGQFYPPANIDFYHPIERHMALKAHAGDNQKEVKVEELMIATNGGF